MKLTAFRIRNFRSIKDTDWHELAYDNITCLIGQNESGKTSVLEGLKAFYDGYLVEDMLRSDLSLPFVSCKFYFSLEEIKNRIDLNRIHPDIREAMKKIAHISICRQWEQDLTSYLTIGEELDSFFKTEQEEKKNRFQKVEHELDQINNELKKAQRALEKSKEEYDDIYGRLCDEEAKETELKRKSRGFFKKNKNASLITEIESINNNINQLKTELQQIANDISAREESLSALDEKKDLRKRILSSIAQVEKKENNLNEARRKKIEIGKLLEFPSPAMNVSGQKERKESQEIEIELAKDELEKCRNKVDLLLLAAEKYFDGKSYHQAYSEAEREIKKKEFFWGPSKLAEELFHFIPEYEMFEDFSSLLPNRIDLADIINKNTAAEGYKAALNFLTITELDYSFFNQPSSRILKQKIENLNGELTLNFQDFWRQNVGKNNKIKINFELAHYDASHAEKSGQPFIEFWIKDESERLYPKQRSRGVRWFLSFFMELKATAVDQNRRNRILLIDEPGVSLHARAQEDVLEVFDDIKEEMQIIYSTHSPHLIDVNKLYRLIAVQRAIEDDLNSETVLLNSRSFRIATADTLSPVYSMMGARLNQQEIVKSFNNVVVKDLGTYYFVKAVILLTGYSKKECHFLPSSGPSSMPMMINILIGWGLEYIVLNFSNDEEKFIYNKLRKELFDNNVDIAKKQLLYFSDHLDIEDLFSTIDFKKFIVKVREGITISNSEYLKENNHSRTLVASSFLEQINQGKISIKQLDEETRDNLHAMVNKLDKLLK